MKTILVALDYSKCANNALEYAATLSKGMGARLVIFNSYNLAKPTGAIPTYMPGVAYVPAVEDLIKENNKRITDIGAKISQAYGIEVECITTTDLILDGLRQQIKKQHADLVVMGMRGQKAIHSFFGSVTTSMLKDVKVPLLVIPEDAKFRGFRRILLAYDNTQPLKRGQLTAVYELASVYEAKVELLHVEKHKTFNPLERRQVFKNTPVVDEMMANIKFSYRFLADDDILEGIERGIEEFHADLVVMIPRKSGFWESLVHPSLTKKMAVHSRIPVMALPEVHKAVFRKKAAPLANNFSNRDTQPNVLSEGV